MYKHQKNIWIYGKHSCITAILQGKTQNILVTKNTLEKNLKILTSNKIKYQVVEKSEIESLLDHDAVHQGIAALISNSISINIEDVIEKQDNVSTIIILDQVVDPHNIGAVIRSASAFSVDAVIITANNSPTSIATIVKSSSGTFFLTPLVQIINLATTIKLLKKHGYWCYGMDGTADLNINKVEFPKKSVIIMGSEGSGLRTLTKKNCDDLIKINMSNKVESLNVSNAASIAIHEIYKQNYES